MTPARSTHLSEEALDDVLIGLGSLQSEAHLAGCLECRAKVESFHSDMGLLNSASIAWSESKHLPALQIAYRASHSRTRIAFVSWAAVAALLVIAALITWHQVSLTPANRADTLQSQPVDSEAQIAQDNQLLQAVSAAISPNEISPVDEYKIGERPHSRLKARPKMRLK